MASISTDSMNQRLSREEMAGSRSLSANNDEHGTISGAVRYVLSLIRRNLILIIAILAIAVAIAVAVTMLDTPRYTAETSVQINDQTDEVLGDELEQQSSSAAAPWDVERFLNTQLDILQSRGLAKRVARKLNLYESDAFLDAMEVERGEDQMPRSVREQLVIGLLRANFSVNLPRETRIARLTFESADPQVAAEVANTFSEEFIQANLQRRYDSSDYAREFVAEQLAEARARLEDSERELNAYARQAGLIRMRSPTSEDGSESSANSVTAASLSQLNRAANEAQAERVAAEARWRAESAQPLMSSSAVLSNPTVQSLMAQRGRVEGELAVQRARYLDSHPAVVELQDQLESINAEIRTVAQSVRNSIRADYTAANAAESSLSQQVGQLEGATLAEQDRSVRYNTLAREADTNRSIYEGLLNRYRELNASAGIAASNVSVIDRAEPPSSPSSPNLLMNLLAALLLGGGAAAAIVFLRDQLDDAIRVPEDVENKASLPLLGVIPYSDDDDPDSELQDPKSPVSEAYNSLRGSLLYATREGLPPIMLVTSSQPSEGKTTTSFAIAGSLARMGKRVVLIDADLRRPSAHRRLGLPNTRGLSSLLTSADPAASAIQASQYENLSVITSGPIPPSPTELLTSPRIAALLEELRESFDVVMLDSPPVLGLADAPVLSALADGVIFVIEADRSRRGMLKTALRRLRAMDPILLGAVLTKFDPSKASNKYSEYYGYEYYRYAPSDGSET